MANVVANLTEEDIVSVVVYADRMLWNVCSLKACFCPLIRRSIAISIRPKSAIAPVLPRRWLLPVSFLVIARAKDAQNCFLNCLLPTEAASAIGFRIDEIETEILHVS
jgi:hypothetical protein